MTEFLKCNIYRLRNCTHAFHSNNKPISQQWCLSTKRHVLISNWDSAPMVGVLGSCSALGSCAAWEAPATVDDHHWTPTIAGLRHVVGTQYDVRTLNWNIWTSQQPAVKYNAMGVNSTKTTDLVLLWRRYTLIYLFLNSNLKLQSYVWIMDACFLQKIHEYENKFEVLLLSVFQTGYQFSTNCFRPQSFKS